AAHVCRRRSREHAAGVPAAGAARGSAQPFITSCICMSAGMRTGMRTRALNLLLIFALLGAVIASFQFLALNLTDLFSGDAGASMLAYAREFLRPDFSTTHLQACLRGAAETLAMSAIGTLLAALLGLLLALPAAGRFGALGKIGARFVL